MGLKKDILAHLYPAVVRLMLVTFRLDPIDLEGCFRVFLDKKIESEII